MQHQLLVNPETKQDDLGYESSRTQAAIMYNIIIVRLLDLSPQEMSLLKPTIGIY